jgi:E3 ubiquitin-protein ligase RNF115/126
LLSIGSHFINLFSTSRFGAPPTSADKLDALDRMTIDDEDMRANLTAACGVCQDDFAIGDAVVLLPCAHYFHDSCARPWLLEHCTCPNCRFNLNTGRIEPDPPRRRR